MSMALQDQAGRKRRHEAMSASVATMLDPAIVIGLAINASLAMRDVPAPVMAALRDHANQGSAAAVAALEWIGRRRGRRMATAVVEPMMVENTGEGA